MNNVTFLTDIFGTVLNDNNIAEHDIPFILIHCYKPEIILENIISEKYCIYKPIKTFIDNTLYTNNINPSNFCTTGDIWIPNNKMPTKITVVMANKNEGVSKYPINYIIVNEINDMYIWQPICHNNYLPMGLLISKDKPSVKEMVTINKNLMTEYNGHIFPSIFTNMNEFNLLSTQKNKKYTIKRSALLDSDNNIKILSKQKEGYINPNRSGYKIANKITPISHTIQGELRSWQ